ncbi:uncharacterized protein CEXT_670621 [Caerostris extrusa]|uniref:Uncharacterized protein n=1 Tax=Caerostris extrusa TaxID=172846 RepID=A0AAV4UAT9_CAEEX|nr:uncharacterized protein CEXT_670621 [Caerostris extrusa]
MLELEAEVETCLEHCKPVLCQIPTGRREDDTETVSSFGRKKRESGAEEVLSSVTLSGVSPSKQKILQALSHSNLKIMPLLSLPLPFKHYNAVYSYFVCLIECSMLCPRYEICHERCK